MMPTSSTSHDQAVQGRIGHEGRGDLLVEDQRHEADEDQEDDHPHEEDAGRGEPQGIVV